MSKILVVEDDKFLANAYRVKLEKLGFEVKIAMDGEEGIYKGLIYKAQFGAPEPINFTKERFRLRTHDIFDFGYALTVHKAQGSQAKRVILFEERFSKSNDDEWRRWLYTGITRAEEELFIIG